MNFEIQGSIHDRPEMSWYSGEVKTRDDGQPVTRHWMCPEEGCEGEMKSTGTMWPTGSPGYHHRCTVCGVGYAIHNQRFPRIVD